MKNLLRFIFRIAFQVRLPVDTGQCKAKRRLVAANQESCIDAPAFVAARSYFSHSKAGESMRRIMQDVFHAGAAA